MLQNNFLQMQIRLIQLADTNGSIKSCGPMYSRTRTGEIEDLKRYRFSNAGLEVLA